MNRVEKARLTIFGGIGILVAVVLVYGLLYSLNLVGGLDGSDQTPFVVDDRKPLEKDPIVVQEFFSYACIHCWTLEPSLAKWSKNLPDQVEFQRIHIGLSTEANLLGRAFLSLKARDALDANHERLFKAIHERGRAFTSVSQLADFVDGRGISQDAFTRMMQSKRIGDMQSANDKISRDLGISSTPTIVVANKYLVNTGIGREQVVETIDYLIDEVLAGREPNPDSEDADSESVDSSQGELDVPQDDKTETNKTPTESAETSDTAVEGTEESTPVEPSAVENDPVLEPTSE